MASKTKGLLSQMMTKSFFSQSTNQKLPRYTKPLLIVRLKYDT